MNPELKELAEKAGFDLEFGHVLALASHEEVAEFAALIVAECETDCELVHIMDGLNDQQRAGAFKCMEVLRERMARWRSVIPSTPEKE